MKKALYGRRTAGADFRDYFETVLVSGVEFKRGTADPCVYYNPKRQLILTHHIDDGRIVGKPSESKTFVKEFSKYVILKTTGPLKAGQGFLHLNRMKVMCDDGWITVPERMPDNESCWKRAKQSFKGFVILRPDNVA